MRLFRLAVLAAILCCATAVRGQVSQETVSKATVVIDIGKQVCKWNESENIFGPDYEWGCKFVSKPVCTGTVVKKRGDQYLVLTAGHCIIPAQRKDDNYYVSSVIENEPVLHHAKVLKAENDDRYDFALLEFSSLREYPTIDLNDSEDGPPAVGTELLNVNFSYGLGKQFLHGTVTSGLVQVDDMKKRYLSTLQVGPGASGSAVIDVKTGKIVGLVELIFPRSPMGAGIIPTGKALFDFMEDDSAGLSTPPPVGVPPQPPTPPPPPSIWQEFIDILSRLWGKLNFWS